MEKTILILTSILINFSCNARESKVSETKVEIVTHQEVSENKTEINSNSLIIIDTNIIKKANTSSNYKKIEKLKKEDELNTENVVNENVEIVKEPEPIIKPISVSHDVFNTLLQKHVSESGKVNYEGFKNDYKELLSYLKLLELNPPKSEWTKNEKLAYWINLYNASTISLILKHYPVKSIMDINGGKAWDLKFVKSGIIIYTLNQIENEIIRPTFKEPRIHFAVNCAAQSCPKLLNSAFFPSTLDSQLESATRKFINNSSKNQISEEHAKISKIFEWYAKDFNNGEVIPFLQEYYIDNLKGTAKISYLDYNWNLNN